MAIRNSGPLVKDAIFRHQWPSAWDRQGHHPQQKYSQTAEASGWETQATFDLGVAKTAANLFWRQGFSKTVRRFHPAKKIECRRKRFRTRQGEVQAGLLKLDQKDQQQKVQVGTEGVQLQSVFVHARGEEGHPAAEGSDAVLNEACWELPWGAEGPPGVVAARGRVQDDQGSQWGFPHGRRWYGLQHLVGAETIGR